MFIYAANVSDQTGRRREFRWEHQGSAASLARMETLRGLVDLHTKEIIASEPWVCSGRGENCTQAATTAVCSPAAYMHTDPPQVVDLCCVPICADKACNAAAHKLSRDTLKQVSEAANAQDIGGSTKLYETKGRFCGGCGAGGVGKEVQGQLKLKACARCKTVYYCSLECQKLDWKRGHKQVCAKTQ